MSEANTLLSAVRQHTIFLKPAKVSSPSGTTPLEGSGRAVHERERPGVGWNPLYLPEGEGTGGVEEKRRRNIKDVVFSVRHITCIYSKV